MNLLRFGIGHRGLVRCGTFLLACLLGGLGCGVDETDVCVASKISCGVGGSGGTDSFRDGGGGTDGSVLGADPVTQAILDAIGSSTQVAFTVIENGPVVTTTDGAVVADCPQSTGGFCLDAKITLKNTGAAWNATGWAIYYSGIRKVVSVSNPEFTITHINGDLHKIEPTASFTGFAAGQTKEIGFKAQFWMMAETDLMPRFYAAAPGLMPRVITNTDTEELSTFVAPFTTRKQTQRFPSDQSVIETAATRYAANAGVADRGGAAVAAEVVPTPQHVTPGGGSLSLSSGITFAVTDITPEALAFVKARLTALGVDIKATGGVEVRVSVNPNDSTFVSKPTAEAYGMVVYGEGVTIVGRDAPGAFYGLMTLTGLIPADFSSNKTVPQLKVDYDAPRYSYRGAQFDLARNFHGVAEVLKVIDQMAAYKLNALHLHLSDDEAWRVEIPGLSELTTVGAKRCHDLTEKTCLLPQLGSGPDTTTSASGYLTRDDFVQILKAATARYIEVIPEFDMPGHARAAIKSMQIKGDPAYLLSDPTDTSKYESVQNYNDGAINACRDSSYTFIAKVMDEIKAMYVAAGATLSTWDVGADEVAAGAWQDSLACKTLFVTDARVKSANDVHAYFIRKVNALAKARGLGIRGWSDGLRKTVTAAGAMTEKQLMDPATDLDNNPVSINWWSTLFWWDYHNSAYTFANKGYKVILTPPDFLYFDHPYEADPKERGYYWATRFTSVRKLFSFIPGNLPANSKLTKDRIGADYRAVFDPTAADPTPPVNLDTGAVANIIGMEGAQWSETMRTDDQLEYMVFPRMLAMAERAWHRAGWEPADVSGTDWGKTIPIDTAALAADWERFANVLGHKELPKLDKLGVHYRIDVPGATIDSGGLLQANVALPGLATEYKNGNGSWVAYNASSPPAVTSTEIRSKTSDGRAGRSIAVTK